MVNCEIWPSKYHGELRNLALKISWRTAKLSTQNIMVNCEIWPSKYHGKLRNWPSDFRGQLRNYSLQISCGVRAVFVISGASWIQWRLSLFFQDIGSLQLHLRSLSDHAGLTLDVLVYDTSTMYTSEPTPHGTTCSFMSNDGTRPRYLSWCFAPSCKIAKKVLVLSEFFKTLMHHGFSMKFSAWWDVRKRIKNRTFEEGGRWKIRFCPLFFFPL